MTDSTTFTSDRSAAISEHLADRRAVPHLFVVLDCERLHDAASRYALEGISTVHIGRGTKRESAISADGTELTLSLPDRRTSREHARLRCRDGAWIIEDLGAKNGSGVNGRRVDGSTTISPGALIEVGHTFLVLRSSSVPPLADVTGVRLDTKQLGLATLIPELASDFAEFAAVARSTAHVAILGETGSGKDVVANAYHHLTRRSGAFVPVNCGALPATLLEASLFGHKRGAYSGAAGDNDGLVRAADGGTLFLDEIGDLPLPAQAALLRVIEAKEVLPLGASKPTRVDVRIVCATHRDIPAMVARGEFREDLWARLAGFVLRMPPLRDRMEDIGLLVSAAVARQAKDRAERIRLTPGAGRALLMRRWPLNVRELMNAISHAVATTPNDIISSEHLLKEAKPPAVSPVAPVGNGVPVVPPPGPTPAGHLPQDMDAGVAAGALRGIASDPHSQAIRARLEFLLQEHHGNVTEVALALGKARPLVHRWLKDLGIDPSPYRRRIRGLD